MTERKKLRSQAWFGPLDRDGFIHRGWMRAQGLPEHLFDGRPVIGICNTWSELTPCNAHLRALADKVKFGVYEAGGLPLEFPVMSLGETQMRPTAMLFRNLVSMDVEESIRANPIDGVVLLGGCDKTFPALLMGAASCDLPTIALGGGPMLNGKYQGRDIGSGTQVWEFSEAVRAGTMTPEAFMAAEAGMSRSPGHCMTMGSASTMACLVEAMGMSLPGAATLPAVDSRRAALAHMTGRRIVELVREDVPMSAIVDRRALENAVTACGAIGGSTNAVVHLIALAGRLGIDFGLDDWDRLGRDLPCLLDLMPSGRFLMEDFCYAGGLAALLAGLRERLHGQARTVNGRSLGENLEGAQCHDPDVIRATDNPVAAQGGIAVLRGNLAPDGAVLKPSAATPALLVHRGRAVVFEDIDDYKARIDDPDLDVEPEDVLVLKGCGPRGYPGFPEVGNMALPAKLLARGVRDMVRISDARMSGTAYGTVVLHVAPEAAAGGPLALVRNGDVISLDVPARSIRLEVDDAELARRRAAATDAPSQQAPRGYLWLYQQHVLQADRGVDLDFLVGASGAGVPRESH